jgi:hypothetical protein
LNGAGIDLVTVKASPAVWGANFFGSNNTTNLTLANFTIDGNNAPSDITQFYSNKNILFKRIRFKNGLADAVDTQYGESVFIQDCLFENISDNAVSGQDSYCEVLNSRIIGAGFSGAPVFGTYNGMLKLQNVWIEDCVDIFGPAGSFAPVEGCTFLFTNSAVTNIIIDSYQYMKFVNCTFGSKSSDTTIPMIAVRTNAVANFNNCIFQSARAAIFADRPAALTVRDCEFLGAGHCIKARGPSRYIIQNNIFKTDGGSGNAVRLDTTPPASGFVFSGNTLDGCHFYETDGSTNIIQNNILINGAGFNISGSAITGTKIIGNTVSGATTSLDVYEGGLVIANNNFDGDINFHGSGYTNTFVNNLFKTLTGTLSGINTNGNSNVKF